MTEVVCAPRLGQQGAFASRDRLSLFEGPDQGVADERDLCVDRVGLAVRGSWQVSRGVERTPESGCRRKSASRDRRDRVSGCILPLSKGKHAIGSRVGNADVLVLRCRSYTAIEAKSI